MHLESRQTSRITFFAKLTGENILVESNTILTEEKEITKTIISFPISITKKLGLTPYKNSSFTNINLITSNFSDFVSTRNIRDSPFPLEHVKCQKIFSKMFSSSNYFETILPFLTSLTNYKICEIDFPI